jgi:dolichyl-phosphate-mannose--protein O-mannosyl transferase
MRTLNTIGRHVVVLLFALALAALLNVFTSRDRFIELSIILSILCLVAYHFRWLLGLSERHTKGT